jgi:hypothetical protein
VARPDPTTTPLAELPLYAKLETEGVFNGYRGQIIDLALRWGWDDEQVLARFRALVAAAQADPGTTTPVGRACKWFVNLGPTAPPPKARVKARDRPLVQPAKPWETHRPIVVEQEFGLDDPLPGGA